MEAIRQTYHTLLNELTFNSKPIITSLTIKAQESNNAANVIVREIEQRIRMNAPNQKLPILYLIDSICKNVGGTYITHFSRNIVSVFVDAYSLVDLQTQASFERLLQTWKNGLPNGGPVFARHLIESMERSVQFVRQKTNRAPANAYQPPPMPHQQRPPMPHQQPPHMPHRQSPHMPHQQPPTALDPRQPPPNTLAPPPFQQPKPQPTPPPATAFIGQIFPGMVAAPVQTQPPQPPHQLSPSPQPSIDTNALLHSLMSKGIIGKPATPNSQPSAPTSGILLCSKDLQRALPNAVECLYADLPLKCKQCGIRYPKTDDGQARMDAHLDSHFRQNRRIKERGKRGLSRSWFVSVSDWVAGAEGELTHHQMPIFVLDKHDANKEDEQGIDLIAETQRLENSTVVKPLNTTEQPSCPICGESFIDVWNDEQEEWVYKNAVFTDDKIYHATCQADADRRSHAKPTPQKRKVEAAGEDYLAKLARVS
ncbi:hypothetical protein DM01DRAFT_1303896 [Hesseltinella vesiculosa]|uniref:CID domain-containing protein n=1 Tax=Hesseltinella vesiculosa TaxID=101127 RepID=A0A1X2GL92_9FUNG|nr:hypothetical protein DM01DRAFT_1303896 [Hesseltinella vesiculosa]